MPVVFNASEILEIACQIERNDPVPMEPVPTLIHIEQEVAEVVQGRQIVQEEGVYIGSVGFDLPIC